MLVTAHATIPWRESEPRRNEDIRCGWACTFDAERFWPRTRSRRSSRRQHQLYIGAAGVIWGSTTLAGSGATKGTVRLPPVLSAAEPEANQAEIKRRPRGAIGSRSATIGESARLFGDRRIRVYAPCDA